MPLELGATHARVARRPFGLKSNTLPLSRRADPLSHVGRRFPCRRAREVVGIDGRDFDRKVEAVEQRAGDARTIPLHLLRRAFATTIE